MTDQGDLETLLTRLRARLEKVDAELIGMVGERRALVLEIGRIKETLGRPVLDPSQEAKVVRRAAQRAREMDVDEELIRDVIWRIIASAREAQTGKSHWGPPEPPSAPDPEG
ncbi:MAG: chorismate mutase [Gemmatimonadales bacterium]|jgi:chorismate mutase|nr:MAG: chorismate mutase [Gemmatimonadales bacterium]